MTTPNTEKVEVTGREAHEIEMAMMHRLHHMPDLTSGERALMEGIQKKFHDAYVAADWEDFQDSHPRK